VLVEAKAMSAAQSSFQEFIELERSASLRERVEVLTEDEANALLIERYSAFREKGHDWWRALKLAVELT
jgi:vacuolar-type H+-ATPase subunit H